MKTHRQNIQGPGLTLLLIVCGPNIPAASAQNQTNPAAQPSVSAQNLESSQDLRDEAQRKSAKSIRKQLKENEQFAYSTLQASAKSKASGTVFFTRSKDGINVVASISGLSKGRYGFHIHENGDCSAPDFSSAGGHYNPTGAPHGGPDSQARHVGDLGNITINSAGVGLLNRDFSMVKGFTDWGNIVGKSVVLHSGTDDLRTQPAGNAGERIACGVIREMPVETAQL